QGDGHVHSRPVAGGARDSETTANAFHAFAHVRQTITAALSLCRIETDAVVGDFNLKFGRLGENFELNFGRLRMFNRVVERFSEREEELVARLRRNRTMRQSGWQFDA